MTAPPNGADLGLAPLPDDELQASPALRHIRRSGARLYDLGAMHGLRTVFAVARDPSSGRDVFEVFYVTPDGGAAIRGIAQDAGGNNLTRAQVAAVPGALPRIEVTPGAAPGTGAPEAALKAASGANFGTWGPDGAPRLYAFVDPVCPFTPRALDALRPHVERGEVQVAVVPVAILDHANGGRSTPAALSLLEGPAGDMAEALARGRAAPAAGASTPEAGRKMLHNQQAAAAAGLRASPTFVWAARGGGAGRKEGVPDAPGLGALLASIAPAS